VGGGVAAVVGYATILDNGALVFGLLLGCESAGAVLGYHNLGCFVDHRGALGHLKAWLV